jgi:hypothetical protein
MSQGLFEIARAIHQANGIDMPAPVTGLPSMKRSSFRLERAVGSRKGFYLKQDEGP